MQSDAHKRGIGRSDRFRRPMGMGNPACDSSKSADNETVACRLPDEDALGVTALTGMVKCRSRTSAGTCRAEGVSTPYLDSFSSIHEVNLFVVRIPRRIPFDSRRVASCPLESSVPQKDICTPKRKDRSQRGFCRVVTGPVPSGQVILSKWRRRESNPRFRRHNELWRQRVMPPPLTRGCSHRTPMSTIWHGSARSSKRGRHCRSTSSSPLRHCADKSVYRDRLARPDKSRSSRSFELFDHTPKPCRLRRRSERSLPQPAGTVRADAEVDTRAGCE